jgi:hypothetical protein
LGLWILSYVLEYQSLAGGLSKKLDAPGAMAASFIEIFLRNVSSGGQPSLSPAEQTGNKKVSEACHPSTPYLSSKNSKTWEAAGKYHLSC